MALTMNMATDERLMRGALADIIFGLAASYGFDSNHIHTRRRYVRDSEKWTEIALVADATDGTQKVLRLITVETSRSSRTAREWSLTWAVKVGMGFDDARADGTNSTDELMSLAYTILQHLFEDKSLGLDEQITVTRAAHEGTRFVPQDASGRPSHVADLTINAVVEYC